MIPIRYNVRSLAVRKATTIATAFGIALVVFVLASSLMLSAGIRKTLGSSGKADNAIVLRMGSDAELGSIVEESSVPLILAAPGVKTDDPGQAHRLVRGRRGRRNAQARRGRRDERHDPGRSGRAASVSDPKCTSWRAGHRSRGPTRS